MANEVTLIVETHIPINFTKGAGTAIAKGAICKLTDNMVAAIAAGDEDLVAGIAQSDALAGDTSVALFRGGIFRGTSNAGVTVGDSLATAASSGESNEIDTATATAVGAKTLGTALETAGADAEFLFELNPGVANQAYA